MNLLLSRLVRREAAHPGELEAMFSPSQGLPSRKVPNLDPWKDARGFLPKPALRWNRVHSKVACFRPCRPEGPRIELEHLHLGSQERDVVHVTGLGGSGVSLAWGAALEAVNLFEAKIPESDRKGAEVSVIGAGIVGLCTAFVLQERGYEVHIYAHRTHGEIPSSQAGALLSPEYSRKEASHDPEIRARDERLRRYSFACLRALLADRFRGIGWFPVFVAELEQKSEDWLWKQEITLSPLPDFVPMKRLPFRGVDHPGTLRWTIRLDMSIYLAALRHVVEMRSLFKIASGGMCLGFLHHFDQSELLQDLPAETRYWFNCTGGLDPIFPDPSAFPIRGLLLLLESQQLPYAFYHMNGYGFPRMRDRFVVGGTYEENETNPHPPEERFRDVLAGNQIFFGLRTKR